MAFADASGTRLAYVAESTENEIPGSPSWQNLRFTSEGLNYNKETRSSEEIRADRNVSDLIDVGFGVGGTIGFELSYGTLDALLESVLFNTWSSNVLKNGTTKKSLAFEKTFETGATDQYFRYTGCQVGNVSLALEAREIVTGSFGGVMGRGHSTDTAALSGATYAAANTKAVMAASADVGTLSLTGISPSPTLRTCNFNVENNLREQPAIGSRGPVGIGSGRCVVTGSLEAYFKDLALYNAFKNHTNVDISLTVGSVTNEKYTIRLPKTYLSAGTIQAQGNDQDVMAAMDFQAVYSLANSPADDATITITRAVA